MLCGANRCVAFFHMVHRPLGLPMWDFLVVSRLSRCFFSYIGSDLIVWVGKFSWGFKLPLKNPYVPAILALLRAASIAGPRSRLLWVIFVHTLDPNLGIALLTYLILTSTRHQKVFVLKYTR